MQILVPLNDFSHLKQFYEAGAREFYIGFYDDEWEHKYGIYSDINRLSGFKKNANKYNFHELILQLQNVADLNYRCDISIYITFNASTYSEQQMCDISSYLEQLSKVRIEGVIISSLELVMLAKEYGIPSVISTIAGVYNSKTVEVYQKYGARRIILPRDLSTEEIRDIMKHIPNMEYEIFLMRNGCTFSDSNCLGFHRKEKCSICSNLANADKKFIYQDAGDGFHKEHDLLLNHNIYSHYFHDMACGLCAIYRFVQYGVNACKIVGRSEDMKAIYQDIAYVHENIEIAQTCKSEDEYLRKMTFPDNKEEICRLGLSCYYPEIRF